LQQLFYGPPNGGPSILAATNFWKSVALLSVPYEYICCIKLFIYKEFHQNLQMIDQSRNICSIKLKEQL
jgi:hypothetical protein